MRFMTEEKRHKYPALANMGYQCQSYSMRKYGGCSGCGTMVPGCEKVVEAGKNKRK